MRNSLGLQALQHPLSVWTMVQGGAGQHRGRQPVCTMQWTKSHFRAQWPNCQTPLQWGPVIALLCTYFLLCKMTKMTLPCRAILGIKWDDVYFWEVTHRRIFSLIGSQWPLRNGNSYIKFWNCFPITPLSVLPLTLLPLCCTHRKLLVVSSNPLQSGTLSPIPFLRK